MQRITNLGSEIRTCQRRPDQAHWIRALDNTTMRKTVPKRETLPCSFSCGRNTSWINDGPRCLIPPKMMTTAKTRIK